MGIYIIGFKKTKFGKKLHLRTLRYETSTTKDEKVDKNGPNEIDQILYVLNS